MKKVKINFSASVVEMNTFRELIIALGLGCNRVSDRKLLITDKPEIQGSFWTSLNRHQYQEICTIDIGVGICSDCLYSEEPTVGMVHQIKPSMEWVDFSDTLLLIVKTLSPGFIFTPCKSPERQRKEEHKIAVCSSMLLILSEQYNAMTPEEKSMSSKIDAFFSAVEIL